jgi:hypothetical protein
MKKVIKDLSFNPVLIEVPKPVNQMTPEEMDVFVDEILDALEGRGN